MAAVKYYGCERHTTVLVQKGLLGRSAQGTTAPAWATTCASNSSEPPQSPRFAQKVRLVDILDIFYLFFCSGEGKGKSEEPGGGSVFDLCPPSPACEFPLSSYQAPYKIQDFLRGVNGRGRIPHRRERCNVCPQWCRDTRTVTRVRHHPLCLRTTRQLRDSTVALHSAQSVTVP